MNTLLGLLLLVAILATWLDAPRWLANTLWTLLSASVGVMLVAGTTYYIRHRVPFFRGVRFADEAAAGRYRSGGPPRLRWRRRPAAARRTGAVRAWIAHRGLQVAILGLFPATFAIAIAGLHVEHRWLSIAMVLGAPVVALAVLERMLTAAQRSRRHRQRVRAPDAARVLLDDPRPPVLLLRAFRADEGDADEALPGDVPMTFEEVITAPLTRYGPVITIGRPGERLPPLGAYREYVREDWQRRVRERLSESSIIVAILDDTPGLQWELDLVRSSGLQHRLLLVVRNEAGSWLPGAIQGKPIGDTAPGQDVRARDVQTLALVFGADGSAHRIVGPYRHAEYYRDAVRLGAKFIRRNGVTQ
jgi:hypothetical protein